MTKRNKQRRWGFLVALLAGVLCLGAYANNGQAQNRTSQGDRSKSGAFLNQTNQYLSKKISVDIKNQTRLMAIQQIADKAGMKITYNTELEALNRTVHLNYKEISVEEALWETLEDAKIRFAVSKSGQLALFPYAGALRHTPPTGTITGTVTDAKTGDPLTGANVIISYHNRKDAIHRGISTDVNGRYTFKNLEVDTYDVSVSFVGYQAKEKMVHIAEGKTDTLNFELNSQVNKLEELTVDAGYYQTTKATQTGSITKVTAKEIEKQPVDNALSALVGRVPGLQITSTNTVLYGSPEIQIRGDNSIASGTFPLIIVDGMPISEMNVSTYSQAINPRYLGGIAPSDIEEVNVLKGADATSLYGSRGANGVILIKTKRGEGSQLKVNINSYAGFKKVGHSVDFLNQAQYEDMRREALENDGITPDPTNAPDLFEWDASNVHNWQNEFIGNTNATQNMNLSISGGTDNTHFYISPSYHKAGSVGPGDRKFQRKSIRANINHNSQDGRFKVNLSSSYSKDHVNLNREPLVNYITLPPAYPIYKSDGTPNWDGARDFPLANTLKPYDGETKNYGGSINLQYEIIKGLKLKLDGAYNNVISDEYYKQPIISIDPNSYYNTSQARSRIDENNTWIIEPQAEYMHSFREHNFKLLIGGTFQKSNGNSITIAGRDFPSDALLGDMGSAGTKTISTSFSEYTYGSFFSRLHYDYKKKFLANINFRRDGSSRFGPGKRFGHFGSVGLGWVFSKEPWLTSSLPFLSFGKIRASYGISGNDQIGNFGYISTYYSTTSGLTSYDGFTLQPSNLGNPDYSWENTKKAEVGLDLGFLQNRISLNASVYSNYSDNQLVYYTLSPQSGFSGFQANLPATVQNKGFELELKTQNIKGKSFSWETALNLSKTQNILKKFNNIENTSYYSSLVVGKSMTVEKAYISEGLDNTGVPVLKDLNNDGTINSNDRRVIGDRDPFYGGMSNSFTYKNLNLSFDISYRRVSDFSNLFSQPPGDIGSNPTTFYLNRWQKPGDENHTDIPKFTTNYSSNNAYYANSDVWWTTQHIFRLSNLSLSYHLPASVAEKLDLSTAKIYMNAQNLWVFDKYKKYRLDPVSGNGQPPLRTITFGINLTF